MKLILTIAQQKRAEQRDEYGGAYITQKVVLPMEPPEGQESLTVAQLLANVPLTSQGLLAPLNEFLVELMTSFVPTTLLPLPFEAHAERGSVRLHPFVQEDYDDNDILSPSID